MFRPRGRLPVPVFVVIALIGLSGLVGCAQADGCSVDPSAHCVHVLFVGNSYTSTNDLPGMLATLAAAGGRPLSVAMVAVDGETLAGHVETGAVQSKVSQGAWDFVVLQEQSEVPAMADARRASMLPAVNTLAAQIRSANAAPLLFLTWAHRDGLSGSGLGGYAAMQSALDDGYLAAAREAGAGIVPVGDAWSAALRSDPALDLWQADGSHPTRLGTLLAAATFYTALFDADPTDVVASAGGLASADAAVLSSAVSATLSSRAAWGLP